MAPRNARGSQNRRASHRGKSERYSYATTSILDGDGDSDKAKILGISMPNPLSYIRGLFSSPVASWSPTRILLVGGISAVILAPLLDTLLRESVAYLRQSAADPHGLPGAALPQVDAEGRYHGRYPNSLLTLFFPYTLFSDVVLDQPVSPDDVPFFWHAHRSDEVAVKAMLTRCYGADLVELDSVDDIEKAKRQRLIATLAEQDRVGVGALRKERLYNGQRRKPVVIASPHIKEAAELFTQDNFGRTFSFYRHPIDYDVHPDLKKKLPPEAGANNFLTRLLSGAHTGVLGFKELGISKQVIRQTTIVGTRDLMAESMFRFGKYYGWVPVGGEGTKESEEKDNALAMSCIEDIVKDVPGERYADHNSPEWQLFYKLNKLDCQLYEIARSTWRAQIQTIVPLVLQRERARQGDETESDEDEDTGEEQEEGER